MQALCGRRQEGQRGRLVLGGVTIKKELRLMDKRYSPVWLKKAAGLVAYSRSLT
jgi:hypothetical protein